MEGQVMATSKTSKTTTAKDTAKNITKGVQTTLKAEAPKKTEEKKAEPKKAETGAETVKAAKTAPAVSKAAEKKRRKTRAGKRTLWFLMKWKNKSEEGCIFAHTEGILPINSGLPMGGKTSARRITPKKENSGCYVLALIQPSSLLAILPDLLFLRRSIRRVNRSCPG